MTRRIPDITRSPGANRTVNGRTVVRGDNYSPIGFDAIVDAVVVDGKIKSCTIVDPGHGYHVTTANISLNDANGDGVDGDLYINAMLIAQNVNNWTFENLNKDDKVEFKNTGKGNIKVEIGHTHITDNFTVNEHGLTLSVNVFPQDVKINFLSPPNLPDNAVAYAKASPFSYVGQPFGAIAEIVIVNPGSGYYANPIVSIVPQKEDSTLILRNPIGSTKVYEITYVSRAVDLRTSIRSITDFNPLYFGVESAPPIITEKIEYQKTTTTRITTTNTTNETTNTTTTTTEVVSVYTPGSVTLYLQEGQELHAIDDNPVMVSYKDYLVK